MSSATFFFLLLPTAALAADLPILHPFSPRAAASGKAFAPIGSGAGLPGAPAFVVKAALGTPPQPLLLALDTSLAASAVVAPPFSVSASSTFRPNSSTSALPLDTLLLAGLAFPNFPFAILAAPTGRASLALGRGPLALPARLTSSVFSYCLPSYRSANFSGTLRLGPRNQPLRINSTRLLSNPHRSSLYYVPMTAVRVGTRFLPIPPSAFAFDPATGAGTVVSTGTLFTRLVRPAYQALRDEFRRRVGAGRPALALGGFDTCYDGVGRIPTVSFHFEGGMFVTLAEENVVIRSTGGPRVCLAMAESAPDEVNSVVNVIAAWQQQNHRVVVNVAGGRLGVARELCTTAP